LVHLDRLDRHARDERAAVREHGFDRIVEALKQFAGPSKAVTGEFRAEGGGHRRGISFDPYPFLSSISEAPIFCGPGPVYRAETGRFCGFADAK